MKSFARHMICGAAFLVSASLWATDPEVSDTTYTPCAEKEGLSLDLRTQTETSFSGNVVISYSSVGWEQEEIDDAASVTLTVTPLPDGETVTIASGLTGRSSFTWTPSSLAFGPVYRFDHYVIKGDVTNAVETLHGNTSFVEVGEIEPQQVFANGSATCAIANDKANPWTAGETAADGISAPSGASKFTFKPIYGGTLLFDYRLTGGTLEVYVDGALAATLSAAADWTLSPEITVSGQGTHQIEVRALTGAAAAACLRQVVWSETDGETTAFAASAVYRVDLTNGVRCVRDSDGLLPFVYSPTNFTGITETAEPTVARVRVVQLTGDEAEGVESWTNAVNEIASTERILVDKTTAEDSVVWIAKLGVWKLMFDILADDTVVRSEYAIFDARKLKKGFMLLLK